MVRSSTLFSNSAEWLFSSACALRAFGGVAEDEHHAENLAPGVVNGRHAVLDRPFLPRPRDQEGGTGQGDQLFFLNGAGGRVLRLFAAGFIDDAEDGEKRFEQRFHAVPAGEPLRFVIHENDAPFRIGDDDAVADGGERDAEPFLLLFQIGLGADQLGVALLDGVKGAPVIDRELEKLAPHELAYGQRQHQREPAAGKTKRPLGRAQPAQPLVVQFLLNLGEDLKLAMETVHQIIAHLDPVGADGQILQALVEAGLRMVEPEILGPNQFPDADFLLGVVLAKPRQFFEYRVGLSPPFLEGGRE